jgi:predicted ATP-dependent Lon-type protease
VKDWVCRRNIGGSGTCDFVADLSAKKVLNPIASAVDITAGLSDFLAKFQKSFYWSGGL